MDYTINWQLPDGERVVERIDAARFEGLRKARECIIAALDIEENYNGLLDRYISFQKELVDVVLNMTVRHRGDWDHFRGASQRLNREVICLLSSARQYIDQAKHSFSDLAASIDDLNAWFAEEYDGRLGYRTCEGIRNSSQHRLLPAHSITLKGGWTEDRTIREHGVQLFVMPATLRAGDPKFKKSILDELEARGEQVELLPLLRDYLNGLAVVNSKVRKKLATSVDIWIEQLQLVYESKERSGYCRAYAVEGGVVVAEIPIFPEITARLRRLCETNPSHGRTFDYRVTC